MPDKADKNTPDDDSSGEQGNGSYSYLPGFIRSLFGLKTATKPLVGKAPEAASKSKPRLEVAENTGKLVWPVGWKAEGFGVYEVIRAGKLVGYRVCRFQGRGGLRCSEKIHPSKDVAIAEARQALAAINGQTASEPKADPSTPSPMLSGETEPDDEWRI